MLRIGINEDVFLEKVAITDKNVLELTFQEITVKERPKSYFENVAGDDIVEGNTGMNLKLFPPLTPNKPEYTEEKKVDLVVGDINKSKGILRHIMLGYMASTELKGIWEASYDGIAINATNFNQQILVKEVLELVHKNMARIFIQKIAPFLNDKTIIASAVSGLSIDELQKKCGSNLAIVHIMPNIAVRFGQSATCISFAEGDKIKAKQVVDLFNNLGTVSVIDEKLMDAATVLGACGTAYALRYIRASMQAGIEIGFDAATALSIASQTAKGAATMALEEKIHPEQLIDRVTTPQGCTIVGLNEMEHEGFSSSLIKGIKTSLKKITG